MKSLLCALALLAGACLPDESEPSYQIVPNGGTGRTTMTTPEPTPVGTLDAGTTPNVPDSGVDLFDGGVVIGADAGDFPQDAGPFLDAFTPAPDGPSNPGGDQIP